MEHVEFNFYQLPDDEFYIGIYYGEESEEVSKRLLESAQIMMSLISGQDVHLDNIDPSKVRAATHKYEFDRVKFDYMTDEEAALIQGVFDDFKSEYILKNQGEGENL